VTSEPTDDDFRRRAALEIGVPPMADKLGNDMIATIKTDSLFVKVALFWACLLSISMLAILRSCEGHLIYSLDDPYISLAVARNILHGVFGVNVNEVSSPCSSLIWPWMLAVTEFLGFGAAGPLVLDALAVLGAINVSLRLSKRLGLIDMQSAPYLSYALAAILLFVTSAVALPLTGMEHPWHVFGALLILDGLLATTRGEKPSRALIAAIVLTPLLRLEGAAFSLAAIGVLWVCGHRKTALVTTMLCGVAFAAVLSYMRSQDLPLLPSSVMLKSDVTAAVYRGSPWDFLIGLARQLARGMDRSRALLVICAVAIGLATRVKGLGKETTALLLAIDFAIVAHLMFGPFGAWYRYEVYVLALAYFGALYAVEIVLASERGEAAARPVKFIAIGAGLVFGWQFGEAALRTPAAAQNMYGQQYQMRRFVQDYYKMPVAVNDLGLVSYGNPKYVLDLWGLGSEEVRLMKLKRQYGVDQIASLVDHREVKLIMIYDHWYPQKIPAKWIKLAELDTPQVTAGGETVSFYATPDADRPRIVEQLKKLQPTLPPQDSLRILDARADR